MLKSITFRNIGIYNATDFGVTIRQDYDNGGPTCKLNTLHNHYVANRNQANQQMAFQSKT
jgi:hypothetical protein